MDTTDLILKGAMIATLAAGFEIAGLLLYVMKPEFGKRKLEHVLYLYYVCFIILSYAFAFLAGFSFNYVLEMSIKPVIITLSLTHAICLPIFHYVFIRHVMLLQAPMILEPAPDEELKKGIVQCAKQNKRKKAKDQAALAGFAMVIFGHVCLSVSILVLQMVGA